MGNFCRQLRLAGAVVLMLSLWFHNWPLLGMGFALVAVGVVNGLYFLELRVEELEGKELLRTIKENDDEKDDTKKSH